MSVNIGAANADDAFYRYKMPKLQAKIEGRGNGIKTNVVNMVDVAKALARPPAYTTKFFGFELGAQTTFDKESGKAIVNGAHEVRKLTELLEIFIKKFVQCYACGNPETVMKIDKKQCILLDCKACGFRSSVDMRHKLTGFILKNPPEDKKDKKEKQLRRAEKERMEEGEKLDAEEKARRKEEKRKKKEAKEAAEEEKKREKKERKKKNSEAKKIQDEDKVIDEPEPEEEEEEDDDDTVWQTDTSAAAANARMKEQLSAQTAALVNAKEIKEEKAPKAVPDPNAEDDDEEDEEEDEMEAMIEGVRKIALTKTVSETVQHVRGLKEATTAQDQMAIVFMAFFHEEPEHLQKNLLKRKALLNKMAPDEAGQKLLLACLEHMLTEEEPSLLPKAPLLLKCLYDEDILEEESIIAWHDGGAKLNKRLGISEAQGAAIRKASNPLITWLKEAEEEDDEDDE